MNTKEKELFDELVAFVKRWNNIVAIDGGETPEWLDGFNHEAQELIDNAGDDPTIFLRD